MQLPTTEMTEADYRAKLAQWAGAFKSTEGAEIDGYHVAPLDALIVLSYLEPFRDQRRRELLALDAAVLVSITRKR